MQRPITTGRYAGYKSGFYASPMKNSSNEYNKPTVNDGERWMRVVAEAMPGACISFYADRDVPCGIIKEIGMAVATVRCSRRCIRVYLLVDCEGDGVKIAAIRATCSGLKDG